MSVLSGPSVRSDGSRRVRLNVSALLGDEVIAKFLIVVDEEAGMEQLLTKVQQQLKRNGLHSTVHSVLNGNQATLPSDELVGDILRDKEEIIVLLRGNDGQMLHERVSARRGEAPPAPGSASRRHMGPDAGGGGLHRSSQLADVYTPTGGTSLIGVPAGLHQFGVINHGGSQTVLPVRATVTLPPQAANYEDSSDEDNSDDEDAREPLAPVEDYPPMPAPPRHAPEGAAGIPGPYEEFECERMPYETMVVDHPHDPVQLSSYDNDWLVDNFTPRLREFIMSSFQADLITEPKYVPSIGKFVGAKFLQASGCFVSVFMRPQTAIGSDPNATLPVHYNIAKSDLMRFQRKVEKHIDELQQHQELFKGAMRALKALLGKGMSDSDQVNTMLPHAYDYMDEVEGMQLEADRPMLPLSSSGSHPIIIVDTSGAVARNLPYVKAAMKRALHAHVAGKASFQLIRFRRSDGEPRLWSQEMMPPTEGSLQAAEDWIDALQPAPCGRLMNAVKFALAHKDCDEIYIVSSAESFKAAHHESVLHSIRHLNHREVAINTVGVDPAPEGELMLRYISESNHGDFILKSFSEQGFSRNNAIPSADMKWTSWRTNLVNEKSEKLASSFKEQKMSIGSQIRIIEVMLREESRKEATWHEEWRAAQRLLGSQKDAKKAALPDRDMIKELERKSSRTVSARVGGGYLYQTDYVQLGMEQLFEHKSAVPWTAHSDTLAVGPKMPLHGADKTRMPKLPPSLESMPMAPAQESEQHIGGRGAVPRSRGGAQATQRPRGPGGGGGGGNGSNPWANDGMDRTRRPAARQGGAGSSGSGRRAASADRAAGVVRSPSPAPNRSGSRRRSQTPPAVVERRVHQAPLGRAPPPPPPPPPPAPPEQPGPVLERRWSF
ncbi:unnamed protein product [Polarella glacialis]|uniref:Uncharacterized protein n=1 Tax=Polarella glacialis TaxID=89957 RepID=A0A813E989_POLGL|nr:unnamed protein product [Polarella glacialis]